MPTRGPDAGQGDPARSAAKKRHVEVELRLAHLQLVGPRDSAAVITPVMALSDAQQFSSNFTERQAGGSSRGRSEDCTEERALWRAGILARLKALTVCYKALFVFCGLISISDPRKRGLSYTCATLRPLVPVLYKVVGEEATLTMRTPNSYQDRGRIRNQPFHRSHFLRASRTTSLSSRTCHLDASGNQAR